MKRYLVVGASGTVGSNLVKALVKENVKVRATTSKKSKPKSEDLVEWAHVNLVTTEGLEEAFEGVDRAFLISPPGHADQKKILLPLIQEATRRKLEKVVLMTAMGANAVDTAPFRQAELELERSGMKYNIIRPNWFMQNFNTFWVNGIQAIQKIQLPAGNAKTSFIDARDVSEVAARLLTSDEFNSRDFDLTGPESLNHSEIAAHISRVAGKAIGYEEVKPDVLKSGLLSAGLPADYVDFMLMIFGFLREGYNARITSSVKEILGRDPISFTKYAADYRSSFEGS